MEMRSEWMQIAFAGVIGVALLGGSNQAAAQACTKYVNSNVSSSYTYSGSDSNSGTASAPFQSLQHAADLSVPGDKICATGTFSDTNNIWVLHIYKPGTSAKPIEYTAISGYSSPIVQLTDNSWSGINISALNTGTQSAPVYTVPSFITVDSFQITGINAANSSPNVNPGDNQSNDTIWSNYSCQPGVTQAAQSSGSLQPPCSASVISSPGNVPRYNGAGIYVDGTAGGSKNSSARPHHITFEWNQISECAGSGIGAYETDYTAIVGNTLWHNAYYTAYAGSGISVQSSWDSYLETNADNKNTKTDAKVPLDTNFNNYGGYHIVVDGNWVLHNYEYVPWTSYQNSDGVDVVTDGEGIIIDTNQNSAAISGFALHPYGPSTLVSNNVIVDNGSAGIEVLWSANVDVLNNSTFGNSQNQLPYVVNYSTGRKEFTGYEYQNGELNLSGAFNVNVINNIFMPASPGDLYGNSGSKQNHQTTAVYRTTGNDDGCTCLFANNVFSGGSDGLAETDSLPSGDKASGSHANTFPKGNPGYTAVDPGTTDPASYKEWNTNLQPVSGSSLLTSGQVWYRSSNPNSNYAITNTYPVTDSFNGTARPVASGSIEMGAYQQ